MGVGAGGEGEWGVYGVAAGRGEGRGGVGWELSCRGRVGGVFFERLANPFIYWLSCPQPGIL